MLRSHQHDSGFQQVLQQEEYEFSDPVTQFLTCLYVDFDFEGAQQKLAECETILENDFFLTALKVGLATNVWSTDFSCGRPTVR